MHFQENRLYGYNAVTMATSPIFFFTTIHFLIQTYQAIQKIWLCFVLPWGGVTPISRPLLENGRSTNRAYMSVGPTVITVVRVLSRDIHEAYHQKEQHVRRVSLGKEKPRKLTKCHISPGILGFEMEKNNIKLKISGSVLYVLLYYL